MHVLNLHFLKFDGHIMHDMTGTCMGIHLRGVSAILLSDSKPPCTLQEFLECLPIYYPKGGQDKWQAQVTLKMTWLAFMMETENNAFSMAEKGKEEGNVWDIVAVCYHLCHSKRSFALNWVW